ncbi:MAG: filamentous hemagglutinin N-terminal domain-containing protein, partial [Betaproteobacteria bacterium]
MKRHASMNRIYRLVWNAVLGVWVVVTETARGRGKSRAARQLVAGTLSLLSSAWLLPPAIAGPTGGDVSAGSASISQSGNTTTINQSSQNLAINWQSFNIGANESVRFNQPNASSIALNRVLGQDPSQILGSLTANGQVFVLNPNGVLFGVGAQVNVGALVASTLNLGDADFMAGKYAFSAPITSAAQGLGERVGVVNQGTLNAAPGGYIALLAPQVSNQGVITARMGSALLVAGNQVTLQLGKGSLLGYRIDQGAFNALVENRQLIQADGGQVFLSAKAANAISTAVVNNTGIIEARRIQNVGGVIQLMGDMQTGSVNVGGTLDACAPSGGNGGFIETSAAHVRVANDAQVTTASSMGLAGTWLIDPTNFTIASGSGAQTASGMGASTLQTALGSGNVSITTSAAANAGDLGDINVNANVNWSSNKLTLTAAHDINVNAVMTANNTASLDLEPASGNVNMGLTGAGFTGQVNFFQANGTTPRSGTGFLTIGGNNFTVITSLGSAGSVTGTDLQGMNGNLAGHYALGANINASATSGWNGGQGFLPSGAGDPFAGSFDGLGHTISALTIYRLSAGTVGLFGYTTSGSVIRNVGLVGASVRGLYDVGGLVGQNLGAVSNSYATGSLRGWANVGALVGNNLGTISNSYATASVSGTGSDVGGLVGVNDGAISNSYATGGVSGTYSDVGGLVGYNVGEISNSYASGNVSGGSSAGGVVGLNNGSVSNTHYDADTVTINGVHALTVGGLFHAQYQDWFSHGLTLDIANYAASLVPGTGGNAGYYLVNSVQGLKDLLGFADLAADKFRLTGSIDLVANPGLYIPYFAGTFDGAGNTISNLNLNLPFASHLGMFGEVALGGTVATLGIVGASVSGCDGIGGLAGSSKGAISNSYATGSFSGNYGVGGLVGSLVDDGVGGLGGSISNSYATGSVSGSSNVGGLVGFNSGEISNSYATGGVSGSSYVGGLVGYNTGAVNSSYWDTQTTGQATSAGGTGMSTAQMMTGLNFTSATAANGNVNPNWNFSSIWTSYDGHTSALLQAFMTPLTVTANAAAKTYDGLAYTGGNGVTYSVVGASVLGTLDYSGSSQAAINAGSYAITPGGLYSNQQGYLISYAGGALNV